MATKDISDRQVCEAYRDSRAADPRMFWPEELLMQRTGQCEKVCFSAMNRADDRGLIEYGVSLRSGWLTDRGMALLK